LWPITQTGWATEGFSVGWLTGMEISGEKPQEMNREESAKIRWPGGESTGKAEHRRPR
jgi:hypothetical protein